MDPATAHQVSQVVLQVEAPVSEPVGIGAGLGGGAISTFLTTLLVGAILIALAPRYVERMAETVFDEPVSAALYGIVVLFALALVVFLLFISFVGIIVAIPLAILAGIVWAVGASLAFIAIGDRLVGHEDGWLKPLVVGAAINGAFALTGLGGIVSFVVGAIGFGAVVIDWL